MKTTDERILDAHAGWLETHKDTADPADYAAVAAATAQIAQLVAEQKETADGTAVEFVCKAEFTGGASELAEKLRLACENTNNLVCK